MPQDTHFDLSNDELALLSDSRFLLEKRVITEKMVALLGGLDRELRCHFSKWPAPFPVDTAPGGPGKISRGENLHGLPFLVLDQPAIYKPEGTLALRVVFWWGNYFLISFQASGDLYKHAGSIQLNRLDKDIRYLASEDIWEIRETHYTFLPQNGDTKNIKARAEKTGFIKLGLVVPLSGYRELTEKAIRFVKAIQQALE
ncbi:MAG TPA: hypothetical protein VFW78_04610 [Bacteroidia bacterium]|nr:hypothetical protein [Bacteroidia bacterium]